ncbi:MULTISPECIES: hypothetical protein [Cytobacillus]|jgi:hypothetical protein|uniref:Uncharacterized protein n=2 Tax=Cytobacillus TaxID=2675230 RepID=A0A380XNE2_CYTFI|nr:MULTISPECIES: hypothetical protein [Cytobacillus]EFV79319.1 hypothetical protein HMPREF1013_00235 [Bacillus sp. 2_A_57_CT2]AND39475.1 hypothetical protein A361_10140 [Cytobacillus oceanisediminis 2691]KAF0825752.1 hypothetical protein KIS1582_0425 [Cytobacillus firmus]MBG9542043.1 hypothetical protein [Cytobacillus firmus]MBG9548059.1 hypothetical protein [Cytobacillus firmus]
MADKENSNYKVSINGKEMTGEEAKQYAEEMVAKFTETLGGFYTKGLEKIQSEELKGNLMESLKPLRNLEGLFTKNSSGIGNMIPALKNLLPVVETSEDYKQVKLSVNGKKLLDLDLSDMMKKDS